MCAYVRRKETELQELATAKMEQLEKRSEKLQDVYLQASSCIISRGCGCLFLYQVTARFDLAGHLCCDFGVFRRFSQMMDRDLLDIATQTDTDIAATPALSHSSDDRGAQTDAIAVEHRATQFETSSTDVAPPRSPQRLSKEWDEVDVR